MDEHRAFDCLDFKLMLTALVDGTAPDSARHTAERHALTCPVCLKLLEEAENTDFMLKLAARAESSELPAGFAEQVLSRGRADGSAIVGSLGKPGRSHQTWGWRESMGWLAAAACLLLSVILWVTRTPGSGDSTTTIADQESTAPVWSGVREPDGTEFTNEEVPLGLDDASADALIAAADLLDRVRDVNADSEEDVTALKALIHKDAVLAGLGKARVRVAPERRADVAAAEAWLRSFSTGCYDKAHLESVQRDLKRMGISDRLRDLAAASHRELASAS